MTLQVFQNHESTRAVVADLDGLDDIRVIQAGGQPRLLEKHRDEGWIFEELGLELLEHEELVESGRAAAHGKVDDAHPAPGELRDDVVPPEARDVRCRGGSRAIRIVGVEHLKPRA